MPQPIILIFFVWNVKSNWRLSNIDWILSYFIVLEHQQNVYSSNNFMGSIKFIEQHKFTSIIS